MSAGGIILLVYAIGLTRLRLLMILLSGVGPESPR